MQHIARLRMVVALAVALSLLAAAAVSLTRAGKPGHKSGHGSHQSRSGGARERSISGHTPQRTTPLR